MLNSKFKAAAAFAGALLLLTGCGTDDRTNASNVLNPLPGSPGAPGTAAAGPLADMIRGTYSGELSKVIQHYNEAPVQTSPQRYSLSLAIVGCPQKADAQCVQANFQTSGEAGTANQTVFMSYLGYTTGTNNAQIHVLQQYPAAKIPGFYDSKIVALELRVALLNGTTYDQAQSKTRVMDCVLSQSAYSCRSDVNNVRFVSGLVKSN